ncbi:malonyl-ACP O-methyltransferase BioC [Endozoicomonas arenosclerae]|uniref:malonyl-ACP O-methyltransferase BioC n=1 Tax=Endozoicomonas arenosclerae TaxID=1633495 RepID=UPI0007854BC4|nr:malonyl-ACP O-methyltransferase BioC [Endozoicomonas arenosclerae]
MQPKLKTAAYSSEAQVDKLRVAANFSRAAATYDSAAVLQKRVAARAMLGLPTECSPQQILDLGSGTGSQTKVLAEHFPEAHVTGLDLAMGMLQFARSQCDSSSWCSGDIEALPFKSNSFDLVFSSLAIQWCSFETVLDELYRILKPGGVFVFSSLTSGTMGELNEAWKQVDSNIHVNGFESFEHQKKQVLESCFKQQSFKQQTETLYYPELFQLLRELKALGVNTVHSRQPGLMTRGRLLQLQEAYETFRVDAGLPLSYQVLYGILRKPAHA